MCVRYYYVLFNIFLQNLLNVLYVVLVALNTYSSVGTGFWGRLVGTAARELTSMWIDTIMHEIGDQFAISDGLMSLQSLQLSPSEHAFFHLRGGLQCSRRYFFFEGLRKSTNATINKLQLKNCLLSRISTWCTQQQNFILQCPDLNWSTSYLTQSSNVLYTFFLDFATIVNWMQKQTTIPYFLLLSYQSAVYKKLKL